MSSLRPARLRLPSLTQAKRLPRNALCALFLALPLLRAAELSSPDGQLTLDFHLTEKAEPAYRVLRGSTVVIEESLLGLRRDDEDFTSGLKLQAEDPVQNRVDDYELPGSKRLHNHHEGRQQVFHLISPGGKPMDLIFELSNDGVAFRYRFPNQEAVPHTIREETSHVHFATGARAWLQPAMVPKTGWAKTNPSYEEHYQKDIEVGTPSTLGVGWVFPALFRSGDTWVAVTESALTADWCGSRLRHASPNGDYSFGFPDERETMDARPVEPLASALPWQSPWRVLAIGDLKTVAESSLGTDFADKPTAETTPPAGTVIPGKAAWSWPLLGDKHTIFDEQKRFVDYAAEMGWAYCLIDAQWDQQIGYERMQELADYAKTKKVGLLLWYNSNGTWNEAPQTPKNRMHTAEARQAEFARLKAMGIRGVKIDFFGGDGQPVIQLYHEILRDAATYGLLVNFHGTTLPRGWERTYPHLLTAEAIEGFEYITFTQENANAEPSHAAMLPFTRNLFDPMDFTPVCLGPLPHGQRRTTASFELALSVLFVSGIQHYAEIPERMNQQPDYVRALLREVPSLWRESRYLAGLPGREAVFARQGLDKRWYIAGINGEDQAKDLELDLAGELQLPAGAKLRYLHEGEDPGKDIAREELNLKAGEKTRLHLAPYGGFVIVVEK